MAQRTEPHDSLDDFPTPPWATRALIEHVLRENCSPVDTLDCLEPACGAGHMSKVLKEYFARVSSSDVHDYGFGEKRDFLEHSFADDSSDWVITNPPFKLAEPFVKRALSVARFGVAILARTVFIESVGRYENLFSKTPPTFYAQFTERVPMIKGRLDRKATTATSYCWLVWHKPVRSPAPTLLWIPPCRKRLEKPFDYELPGRSNVCPQIDRGNYAALL